MNQTPSLQQLAARATLTLPAAEAIATAYANYNYQIMMEVDDEEISFECMIRFNVGLATLMARLWIDPPANYNALIEAFLIQPPPYGISLGELHLHKGLNGMVLCAAASREVEIEVPFYLIRSILLEIQDRLTQL